MMFSGEKLFELRATHGLPLDISIDYIINKNKMLIDWGGVYRNCKKK